MASEINAEPFGPATTYGGYPESSTWDEDKIYGCVCDSTWSVGFGSGQTQAPQYYAPDCSLRRCPSGNDPLTTTVDETDCAWKSHNGAVWEGDVGSDGLLYIPGATLPIGVTIETTGTGIQGMTAGSTGNKCHIECSNRGTCDHITGTCACFTGHAGAACELFQTGKGAVRIS